MDKVIKLITRKLLFRKEEFENRKQEGNWAKCLKLDAQIWELQGVLMDLMSNYKEN